MIGNEYVNFEKLNMFTNGKRGRERERDREELREE